MLKIVLQRSDIPLDLCLVLLGVGLYFLWKRKGHPMARWAILAGTLLILILSFPVTSSLLLAPLENAHPPLLSPGDLGPVAGEIRFVVVLGGEARPTQEWPLTSQLGATMLTRLTEGIRLMNGLPQSRLVLSGGGRHLLSDAEMMEKLALQLGVPADRIILETQSTTTAEEAMFLKDLLQAQRFILVTSARHMARAMTVFRKAGLDPIPAPTGHLIDSRTALEWHHFLPRSGNMGLVSHVVYEYLATLKARFYRGK